MPVYMGGNSSERDGNICGKHAKKTFQKITLSEIFFFFTLTHSELLRSICARLFLLIHVTFAVG